MWSCERHTWRVSPSRTRDATWSARRSTVTRTSRATSRPNSGPIPSSRRRFEAADLATSTPVYDYRQSASVSALPTPSSLQVDASGYNWDSVTASQPPESYQACYVPQIHPQIQQQAISHAFTEEAFGFPMMANHGNIPMTNGFAS